MRAIVLAGGLGTRLHPLTVNIPKPMVPVANQPLMEYVIYLLRKHKFKDITALLYHQPESIKSYFGDGSAFGVDLTYAEAKEDYGTAGAVKFAAQNFPDKDEPILIISADLITDFDLEAVTRYHRQKQALATLVLTRVANPLPYGIVITDKEGRIKRFLEKPSWSEVFSDTINCGIYVLDQAVLAAIPAGRSFDFSQDLFPRLLTDKKPLYGYVADGVWKDIGSLAEYARVHAEIAGAKKFQIASDAAVDPTVRREGTVIIGAGTTVAADALLAEVSIGRNCRIGPGARLRHSVIWDDVTIGAEAQLEQAIVARRSVVGDRSLLEEGTVIGEECHLGKDVNLKPYVKVWPHKVIEAGATVSRSMVWRERWSRSIFGPYGVTGLCNVELTPEFAAALGAAYGAVLGQGAHISTSRDSHKSSRMIYRALIAGVLSAGVNVSNLEEVPIPVNRYELKALKSRGGFHVRKSPYDPQVIDIKFFDENGMDLTSAREKKIERVYASEEYRRVGVEATGELSFPFHRVAESYKEGALSGVDREAISNARFKVVVDYAYSSASSIFPSILGDLGIEVIAVNAHIDETKITKTRQAFEKALDQLSQIVKSLGADLGVMLDTGAEKVFLCDERGALLRGDQELAVMALLVAKATKQAQIAVPVKASRVLDQLAQQFNFQIIRTKTSVRDMMDASSRPGISMMGENLGGFIFPEFQPAFDAMFTTIKLLELLARTKEKLSAVSAAVPRIVMTCKDVSCAPEKKGTVLRTIIDEVKDEEVDLTDGVKIFDGEDWVLILPDPARPIIHVCAEADNDRTVQKLIARYVEKIDSII
ncbi:MAG: sugar phosphate nucleotidyltransferase [Candidatus Margulisbacteria bacterium]|nr:sugar phosphate nucleotidyltransferase [Candidatus Margulisiibacteriota bacterium]